MARRRRRQARTQGGCNGSAIAPTEDAAWRRPAAAISRGTFREAFSWVPGWNQAPRVAACRWGNPAGWPMVLACSLVVLAMAGSPTGGRHLETTIQDDAVLLHSAPAIVREAARRIAWLGADRTRVSASWSALAPEPRYRRRPGPPFDATDSTTYPREGWLRLDRAVKYTRAAGLEVMLDLAFWAPRWTVERTVS